MFLNHAPSRLPFFYRPICVSKSQQTKHFFFNFQVNPSKDGKTKPQKIQIKKMKNCWKKYFFAKKWKLVGNKNNKKKNIFSSCSSNFWKKLSWKKIFLWKKHFKKNIFSSFSSNFWKKWKKNFLKKKYVFFEKIFFFKQNSLHFLPIVYVSEGPV